MTEIKTPTSRLAWQAPQLGCLGPDLDLVRAGFSFGIDSGESDTTSGPIF